jgi:surfeit locus 1 family protein
MRPLRAAFIVLLGACALAGAALAHWQWQRLHWKEALLERVARLPDEAPQAPPGPAEWPTLDLATHEYRPLALQGEPDPARERLVLASTALGRGHWVMVPVRVREGFTVWVNRGFVDAAHREPASRPPLGAEELARGGLLRLSERASSLPGLSQATRDLTRLNAEAGLDPSEVAPYFVDLRAAPGTAPVATVADGGALGGTTPAGRSAASGPWPRAGLTVLSFHNRHLGYTLTWAALSTLAAAGAVWLWRGPRARRAPPAESTAA